MNPFIKIDTFDNKEVFGQFIQLFSDTDGDCTILVGSTYVSCKNIRSYETAEHQQEWLVERNDGGYSQYKSIMDSISMELRGSK